MKAIFDLLAQGGLAMIPIAALSVLLYYRCFDLFLSFRHSRRALAAAPRFSSGSLPALRRRREEAEDSFRQQRLALGAMIGAAPLLGLLGTVSGMIRTFASLSSHSGEKSMEGLAQGISEVLVATESGLAVALPALLMVYLLHREVRAYCRSLLRIEQGLGTGGRP